MCTGLQLKADDGSIVFARTMEFGIDINSEVIVIPRNHALKAHCDNGHEWQSKYAVVGANAEGLPLIADGVNEKGLAGGLFYFAKYAGYQAVDKGESALTSVDLATWMLTQYASVAEVKEAVQKIKVSDAIFKKWGFTLPVHYIFNDPTGACLVIEYIDGKINLHDNKLGVFANTPDFNWHLTNCSNYINLRPKDYDPIELSGNEVHGTGHGSGFLGMPGDFTPASRFIRVAAFKHTSAPTKDAHDTMLQAFHILNNFDIPFGAVRAETDGVIYTSSTLWTSAQDCTHQRYYFHTYDNRRIRFVDLNQCDLNAKDIRHFSMLSEAVVEALA